MDGQAGAVIFHGLWVSRTYCTSQVTSLTLAVCDVIPSQHPSCCSQLSGSLTPCPALYQKDQDRGTWVGCESGGVGFRGQKQR
jgi:hypothetical protein